MEELVEFVPQGPILCPLLLNAYLSNLFFFPDCNVWNIADNTTTFACDESLYFALNELEHNSDIPADWFLKNYMKMNPGECQLL